MNQAIDIVRLLARPDLDPEARRQLAMRLGLAVAFDPPKAKTGPLPTGLPRVTPQRVRRRAP